MLLEDRLLTGDRRSLGELFEAWAVLARGRQSRVFGGDEVAGHIAADRDNGDTYLGEPTAVLQARDRALVITPRGANVARRSSEGVWRYEMLHWHEDERLKGESNDAIDQ